MRDPSEGVRRPSARLWSRHASRQPEPEPYQKRSAYACGSDTAMSEQCPLTRIVLASASPRRLELLRSLGLEVEAVPSGYGEPAIAGVTPAELATIHAR